MICFDNVSTIIPRVNIAHVQYITRAYFVLYFQAEKIHFFIFDDLHFTRYTYISFFFHWNKFIWSVFFQRFLVYILISLADACVVLS